MRLRNMSYFFICLLVACGGASSPTATPVSVNQATIIPSTLPVVTQVRAEACPPFIMNALDNIRTACNATQRNQVCYSHSLIEAEYNDINGAEFEAPGDIAPLSIFKSLTLLSDIVEEQWGIALMRIQANLPDTLPGQNVTVLLFGNTEFTGDTTQGYYFRSGIGQADCQGAPSNGMMVQTPAGVYEVSLRVNGADIRLGSTVFIQAEVGNEMRVYVLEGRAIVTAKDVTQVVVAGNRTTIPLDNTGNVSAPPAPPEAYTVDVVQDLPTNGLERAIEIVPPSTYTQPNNPGYVQTTTMDGDSVSVPILAKVVGTDTWLTGSVNGRLALEAGTYDIQIATTPPTNSEVIVTAGEIINALIASGRVEVVGDNNVIVPVYMYALTPDGFFAASSIDGALELVAGVYDLTVNTTPQIQQRIEIIANETLSLKSAVSGTLEILDTAGNLMPIYTYLLTPDDTYVGSTSAGVLDVSPGEYQVIIQTMPETRERVTIRSGQTTSITVTTNGTLRIVNAENQLLDLYISATTADGVFANSTTSGELNLLPDVYDIVVQTNPEMRERVTIRSGQTSQLVVPANGTLQVQDARGNPVVVDGYIYRVEDEAYGGSLENSKLELLPGDYIAQINTQPQLRPQITITSGQTTTITVPRSGFVEAVDARGNAITANLVAYTADEEYADESTDGRLELLEGSYTIVVTTATNSTRQNVRVIADQTVNVMIR